MKVLYVQALIEKNEHFSHPVWVYPWELPVLAAAHRDHGITELRRAVFNKKVAPEVETEFDRLANKYKGPEGTDIPYVVSVYGHGQMGLRKLQEEMIAAARETDIVAALPPVEPVKNEKATEFESPFGVPPELSEDAPGADTQASLRDFVSGNADADPTPVAISA